MKLSSSVCVLVGTLGLLLALLAQRAGATDFEEIEKLIAGDGSGGRQRPRGTPFARPYQLFNLKSDPSEASDVLATHDTIGPSLERIQKRSPGQTPVEMDDEHREALKSLGYVD